MIAQAPLFADDRQSAIEALHAQTALYTSLGIVDDLLMRVGWPQRAQRLIDPSCGDGAFLERAIARLFATRETAPTSASQLAYRVQGWEIHRDAAAQARERIQTCLEGHGWPSSQAADAARAVVANRDFLTDGPGEDDRFDLVAGNFPYLRLANVPALLRDEYARTVPEYARADLLHSFLDRCARILTPTGEMVLVAADRFLFNVGAARLRAEIGRTFAIREMHRLDASTAFYRPKHRRAGTPPRIHPISIVLHPVERGGIPLTANPIYPGAETADDASVARLGEIAEVRLAPWLGPEGIFVVRGDVAATLPREALVPAVDTDDIVDGDVLGSPTRWAIQTTRDAQPDGAVARHLRASLDRMPPRGRRAEAWWLPPEPFHRYPLDRHALLVPRIAKRLRAIPLAPGVLPLNHNLSVVAGDPALLARIAAAFQSERVQAWIRDRAARLENGYLSITTTLLKQLPLDLSDDLTHAA